MVLLLICGPFFCTSGWTAEPSDEVLRTFRFGMDLQTQGEHYRAITEFHRAIFLCKESPERCPKLFGRLYGDAGTSLGSVARYEIGRSYLLGSEYERAQREFENFTLFELPLGFKLQGRLLLGRSILEQQMFEDAHEFFGNEIRDLEKLIGGDLETSLQASKFRLKFAEEDAWTALYAYDLPGAIERFGYLATLDGNNPRISGMQERVRTGLKLPRRSPALAGVLSGLLPGLGQVYAGRPLDGLVSFLVNGLFIWGGIEAWEDDQKEVAAVIGFVELGWYGGNIYGAINSAQKFNWHQRSHFVQDMEDDFRLSINDL
jgi:tetratricopeptide (TPR) repeat protein